MVHQYPRRYATDDSADLASFRHGVRNVRPENDGRRLRRVE